MKISTMIEQLQAILQREGDLECTCTATGLQDGTRDGEPDPLPDVWESTVENLIVTERQHKAFTKRVRIYQ